MKYANQDTTLEEFTEWMEELIESFERLCKHPQEFFPIRDDLSEADKGRFRFF